MIIEKGISEEGGLIVLECIIFVCKYLNKKGEEQ
jgi:hypothetical protein